MKTIKRTIDRQRLIDLCAMFPVTAILGPRQCGKTTLVKTLPHDHFLDMENPRDAARLENPQTTLEDIAGLIIIDEIQRKPDLFPLIRYLVDNRPDQKYIILGSASRDLIRQSSESLAGRIGYLQLGGFRLSDINEKNLKQLWLRGGLPKSFLAENDKQSIIWRNNYIQTFLERDIPQLGITIPSATLHRFWTMLCHYNSQIMNYSEMARSFGISDITVRNYLDILEGTFMVRTLQPWFSNTKKRLVKRPKMYVRDSGIFHSLMNIEKIEHLLTNPKLGASWESFALECVCRAIGKDDREFYFWNVHAGSELDLLWTHGGKNYGIEFKYADAPVMTKSIRIALDDLELERLWVVYPGKQKYTLDEKVEVLPLESTGNTWNYEVLES